MRRDAVDEYGPTSTLIVSDGVARLLRCQATTLMASIEDISSTISTRPRGAK